MSKPPSSCGHLSVDSQMNRQLTTLQHRSTILTPVLSQLATLILQLDALCVFQLIKMTGTLSGRPQHHSLHDPCNPSPRSSSAPELTNALGLVGLVPLALAPSLSTPRIVVQPRGTDGQCYRIFLWV